MVKVKAGEQGGKLMIPTGGVGNLLREMHCRIHTALDYQTPAAYADDSGHVAEKGSPAVDSQQEQSLHCR